MKTGIISLCLCAFFFIVPLHCYIIGDNMGVGIQGAVIRYQMSPQGNSVIPITKEVGYVASGLYEGRTAISVLFWVTGTIILSLLTIISLDNMNLITPVQIQYILYGVTAAGISYLISCFFQYGIFLSGPAGVSLPVGVIMMMVVALGINFYKDSFSYLDGKPAQGDNNIP